MTFKKLLVVFLFGILIFPAKAQKVHISGDAPPYYAHQIISLLIPADPLSGKKKIVCTDTVSAAGHFLLSADINHITPVTILCKAIQAGFYLEPGGRYRIFFPPPAKGQSVSANYTAFIDPVIESDDAHSLNSRIYQYDTLYTRFLRDNYSLFGTWAIKEKIKNFQALVDSLFPPSEKNWLSTYTRYKTGSLKFANNYSPLKLYQNYLEKAPLMLENEGYLSFFETFYGDYFSTFSGKFGPDLLYRAINKENSWYALENAFKKDDFLARSDIRKVVAVISIRDAFGDKHYEVKNLAHILEQIIENTSDARLKGYFQDVYDQLVSAAPGFTIPETWVHSGTDSLNLSDFPEGNKYSIIYFTAPWCTSCRKDEQVLEHVMSKFSNEFNLITIATEDQPATLKAFAVAHRNDLNSWYNLNSFVLHQRFKLGAIPTYIIVGPDKKVMNVQGLTPTDGLAAWMEKTALRWRAK